MTEVEQEPFYFDRKPLPAITADQVRLNRELTADVCTHGGAVCCEGKRLRWVLEQLQAHPGVWSTAKAVIEAALEPWPASPTT